MNNELNQMDRFAFLLGTWELEYSVPKSQFSDYDSGTGEGEFKRILNNRYVTFDYHSKLSKGESSAHAIFVWDEGNKIYRYWWFEDSGQFMEAECEFINQNTLLLRWLNSRFIQTFQLTDDGKIILLMKHPANNDSYETILEVTFTKK